MRAIFFSSAIFAQKMGMALSATMVGLVLTRVGFVANQEQTPEALQGILSIYTLVPAVLVLVVAAAALFWNPEKENQKLEDRHKAEIVAER